MCRRMMLVLMLTWVAGAIVPAHAQLPDATALLPDQPWQAASFHAPEGAAEWELVEPDAQDQPSVARVSVTEVPNDQWAIGFSWDTVAPITEGDTLVLSFEARAEGDAEPPGQIGLAFRRTSKPYHHALSETLSLGDEWKQFQVPLSPSVDMAAGGGTLRVNLGTQLQIVEIRNLSLKNYGGEISYLALCRMLDIDPAAGGRQAVGRHLTPDLLWEMSVFDDLPDPDPDFDPVGAWEQTWRIWTCYGYLRRSNRNLGVLRIARTPGDPFTLAIEQDQLNQEGLRHVQTAEVTCALDALASPLAWDLTGSFIGPEGEELPELRLARTVDSPPDGPVAGHWCLFEAVQRLPFDDGVEHSFDLLDGLSVRKSDHTLRYDGAHEIRFGVDTHTLHRFVQIGHGALPFEYWLDEDHRLVLVVSHYRVYVLDPAAEETVAEELESQRSRYERNKERYAADREDDDGE